MTGYLQKSIDLATLAPIYDETSLWSARFGDLLIRQLQMRRNMTVLDIGCGTGFPLFELANSCGTACRWFGVDVWHDALRRAAMKNRVYGLDNVILVRANGMRLPFAKATFDLIVSNLGVNNFEDPKTALAECARVSRPGARVALCTNIKGHFARFYSAYRRVLEELGGGDRLERLNAQEDHRVTEDSLRAELVEAGFTVVRTVHERFDMRFVDGSALLNHPLVRFGFLEGWRGVVEPDDEITVFGALERELNSMAEETGELPMSVPMLYVEATRDSDSP